MLLLVLLRSWLLLGVSLLLKCPRAREVAKCGVWWSERAGP